MYLHVPKVGPLIRDRHLAPHDHLGNALSKRVDARGRRVPLHDRKDIHLVSVDCGW